MLEGYLCDILERSYIYSNVYFVASIHHPLRKKLKQKLKNINQTNLRSCVMMKSGKIQNIPEIDTGEV